MGLGEVERRYQLRELSRSDALTLIRTLAREKGIGTLASLPDDLLSTYAAKMSSYPLVIKWVVGQVALGRDINQLVDSLAVTSGDIARFCFDHIYDTILSSDSRMILCCLAASDVSITRGVLTHLSGLPVDRMDSALRDLTLASLIIQEQEKGDDNSIVTKYSLLPLTLGYMKGKLQSQGDLWRQIKSRMEVVGGQIEEASKAGRYYRYALQDLGATTDEERIAATWALTAHQRVQMNDYEGAVAAFKRATEIAPKLPRIYRNWAVTENETGYYERANELMTRATELAPDDPTLWFTWGQMEKRRNRLDSALTYFQRALKISENDGAVLSAIGDVEKRKGRYDAADRMYRKALSYAPSEERKFRHQIITQTALANNLYRWADDLYENKQMQQATDRAREAVKEAEIAVNLSEYDERSIQTLQEASLLLARLLLTSEGIDASLPFFQKAITERPKRLTDKRMSCRAAYYVSEGLAKAGRIDEAQRFWRLGRKLLVPGINLHKNYDELRRRIFEVQESNGRLRGRIVSVSRGKGFGFIEIDDDPLKPVFLHISEMNGILSNQEFNEMAGKKVTFEVRQTDKGLRATDVRI